MWMEVPFPYEKGSEGGIILRNEEYKGGCLITLEKCPEYYAITCGVYGAMVHTAFCDEEDHDQGWAYDQPRAVLSAFHMDLVNHRAREYRGNRIGDAHEARNGGDQGERKLCGVGQEHDEERCFHCRHERKAYLACSP